MTTLHVLYRNDKTVIQFTANTLLSEILKKACLHYKLSDPANYNLLYNQKPVNLSLPFRLSGIPSASRVTITESTSNRSVQNIRVALQLEDGRRLQANFITSSTLWDILLHFEKTEAGLNLVRRTDATTSHYYQPVLIVLNKEAKSIAELQTSTLRSMNITESLLIKMRHTLTDQPFDNVLGLIENYQPPPSPVTTTSPTQVVSPTSSNPVSPQESTTVISPTVVSPTNNVAKTPEASPTPVASTSTTTTKTTTTSPTPAPATVQAPASHSTPLDVSPTASLPSPVPMTVEEHRPSKPAAQQKDEVSFYEKATSLLKQFSSTTYDEYMAQKQQKQEAALPPLVPENQPDPPADRKLSVYIPSEEELDPSLIEFDETFTSEDFKRLIEANKRIKRESEEYQAILRTKDMRDRYMEQKTKKYVNTTIRLYFPDRKVLEMTFLTHERISRLYDFVSTLFDQEAAPQYYLYITPPRKELSDKTTTLKKEGLFPAAKIYVGLRKGSPPIKFTKEVEDLLATAYKSAPVSPTTNIVSPSTQTTPPSTVSPTATITTTTSTVSSTSTNTTSTSPQSKDIEMADNRKQEDDDSDDETPMSREEDEDRAPKKTTTVPSWFSKGRKM